MPLCLAFPDFIRFNASTTSSRVTEAEDGEGGWNWRMQKLFSRDLLDIVAPLGHSLLLVGNQVAVYRYALSVSHFPEVIDVAFNFSGVELVVEVCISI